MTEEIRKLCDEYLEYEEHPVFTGELLELAAPDVDQGEAAAVPGESDQGLRVGERSRGGLGVHEGQDRGFRVLPQGLFDLGGVHRVPPLIVDRDNIRAAAQRVLEVGRRPGQQP